ncbi:hypothetical protein DW121_11535 [Bacteroides sp. AM10-21B]|nr:hypothetical protein DW121_11535 [Bacteroides sp. AM10-21B]HBO06092.1 hypothetical protein [Bacteroides sp.]
MILTEAPELRKEVPGLFVFSSVFSGYCSELVFFFFVKVILAFPSIGGLLSLTITFMQTIVYVHLISFFD